MEELTAQIAGCEKYKLTSYHEQTAVQQFILPSYREGEDWVAAPADEADGWPHGAPAVLALADRADPRYTWGDQPFHQQDWNKLILIHACARSCGCRLSPQMGHQQSRPQRRREAGSASLALVPH